MEMEEPRRRLSEQLLELSQICSIKGCTLQTILDQVGLKGHSVLTALLSLIFFIPIPLPGLSIPFGILIMLLGIRMMWGKRPHIPSWVSNKGFPGHSVSKVLATVARWLKVFEKLIRPRGKFLIQHRWVYRFNGLVIAMGGILLALPLPPGTNFPPALGIFLLSTGMIEEDGLFVLLGNLILLSIITILVLISIFGMGWIYQLTQSFS